MSRHIVNDPDDLVREALEGLQLTYPDLVEYRPEFGLITRARPARSKVGIVSGGGSGHEPLHAGFVGTGMLDVAIPGAVFASPTALQVVEGTKAADAGRGVVQIVKNYTGDVLNFRIAGEIAADDEIRTESILVDDDLATDTSDGGPGRRGTAAVLLVEKLCGAAAEAGADLEEVARIGRAMAADSRTMSLALQAGTHFGASGPQFDLTDDDIELGVGIHGERGTGRAKLAAADELVATLLDPLIGDLDLGDGSDVFLIVNGLGSAIPLELQVAARATHHQLRARGVRVARSLVGSYVTSLDMHGLSLTLARASDERVRLWDAPVRTPALTW